MLMPFRDTHTPGDGVVRFYPDGTHVVIKRDFGLTTEPECSEAAHHQIRKWFCLKYGIPDDSDTLFPVP